MAVAEGLAWRQMTILNQSEQDDVLRRALGSILGWSTVIWDDDDRRALHDAGRRVLTACLQEDRYITERALLIEIKTDVSTIASRRFIAAAARLVQQRRQHAQSLAQGSHVAAILTSGGLPADGPAQIIGSNVAAMNAAVPAQLEEDVLQHAVKLRLREKPNAYDLHSVRNPLVYVKAGQSCGMPNPEQRRIEIHALTRNNVLLAAATQFIDTKIAGLQARLEQGESPPVSGEDSDSESPPHMG
jgi:hypothetical protein